ncbi:MULTISPECIES: glycerate kinase type-2 family protein [Aminobacterium]|jgi:glycerate 2-kinase|uniref:Hydroxypyruvate reductase n=1 Tax=Aminobacterium colombiense (strain DSM 12261 / ALA-1) TaxID=572547 RepID=D5EFM8_AMICL|nr:MULTISPECIES: glycerate kinase [Aminobacterium]MDD2379400.1 glycerate kinase [Aminobacterium colombiense]ADE57360.1 Hydroxypyruvate reductase [Aminobacterium colombiense DSM 12261]MDD3767827.1 glycerate kinase [Aminobacterium colombiense]MDD4265893.1 glycerate kinase [Aminobacterium colombiense]MDD4586291.1 glycerate kinase [Aminobacterium colombiense]
MSLHRDVMHIIHHAIDAVLPEHAVKEQLRKKPCEGRVILVSIGKAAWRMARAAVDVLGDQVAKGVVITKYEHSQGPIKKLSIWEAGHPLPDENSLKATSEALEITENLSPRDQVLFLVSGGGSALFEKPKEGVSLKDFVDITDQMLRCGANIVEINMIRKRLSAVKGGRFAQWVNPAKVYTIVLSDVLGDRLDSIASGPACPDVTTSRETLDILVRYNLTMPSRLLRVLEEETPKDLNNVETFITGSVTTLCEKAAEKATELGYKTLILTTTLSCEAKDAGAFLASIAREESEHSRPLQPPCAIILGGETVVHVKGKGKGGRNQEIALAAALEMQNIAGVVLVSVGSDGTDGPTDAAGGIVDGTTAEEIRQSGFDPLALLENNDAYHALQRVDALVKTGPTGTNVNDLTVLLVKDV